MARCAEAGSESKGLAGAILGAAPVTIRFLSLIVARDSAAQKNLWIELRGLPLPFA